MSEVDDDRLSFAEQGKRRLVPGIRPHRDVSKLVGAAYDLLVVSGGVFNKLSFGDKGMVLVGFFGAPQALEQPAASAARFLLHLRARLAMDLPAVRLRAGVASGMVYAGPMGGEERGEWTCLGDSVNLAARLMTGAEWGEMLTSTAVRNDAGMSYEFSRVGSRKVKGRTVSETVYRLDGQKAPGREWRYEHDMVGREMELAALHDDLQPAFRGEFAGLVYVGGEAGIGKTRLVRQFHEDLQASPQAIRWVHLSCGQRDGAFVPVRNWLEGLVGVHPFQSSPEKRLRIEGYIDRLCRTSSVSPSLREDLRQGVSFLAAILECHWEDSLHARIEDPRLRHENLLWAVCSLLGALASSSPVILELEDVQWIDSARRSISTEGCCCERRLRKEMPCRGGFGRSTRWDGS